MTPAVNIMTIGFVGLGLMGEPMALNLVRAGAPVIVWNRTPAKTIALRDAGAQVAATPAEVFAHADVVLAMLADGDAIDTALGRGTAQFATNLTGHIFVHMGTTAPAYSRDLEREIQAVGGRYVEAPVSGSRAPAQAGELVALLAGDPDAVAKVAPLLTPMFRQTVECGPVPNALTMKLAVNVFLITMVTGLAEAVHFADCHQLDLSSLLAVLDAGPMASSVSRAKARKLIDADLSPQAAAADVLKNNQLAVQAARAAAVATPLLDACEALYADTVALGHGADDMVAVLFALQHQTERQNANRAMGRPHRAPERDQPPLR